MKPKVHELQEETIMDVSNYEVITSTFKKSIVGVSKKKLLKLAFLAMVIFAAGAISNTASAQVYVTVRPAWHEPHRTVAPSPRHVWIGEEWEMRGGSYVAVGGYWALPPHPGWVWIPGHWARERRGEYWIRGHWARR